MENERMNKINQCAPKRNVEKSNDTEIKRKLEDEKQKYLKIKKKYRI